MIWRRFDEKQVENGTAAFFVGTNISITSSHAFVVRVTQRVSPASAHPASAPAPSLAEIVGTREVPWNRGIRPDEPEIAITTLSRNRIAAHVRNRRTDMANDSSDTLHLLERLRAGDRQALTDLFQRHRNRLRRMVELRMDARLQGRVDASDVLQDAFLDAATYLDNYLRGTDLPPFLWLRCVVSQRLSIYHRRHLGAKMRDVGQEVSLYRDPLPQASSAALASMLLGRLTSPSNAAIRAEQVLGVQEALNALDPLDREVIALRQFEELSRAETAQVLGITEEAGAKRYMRALRRLKAVLAAQPGGPEGT
jgi:RNA polymerase sigma-70 factor, ECF subfamily